MQLDDYVESYMILPTFSIVITREGTQLIAQGSGQSKLLVYAEAKYVFFSQQ